MELKSDFWHSMNQQKQAQPSLCYDKELDTLYFYISTGEKERIIVHYIDRYLAFLYRYSDKEIVGIQIEDFQRTFIPKVTQSKCWRLSDSGETVPGIKDLVFTIHGLQKPIPIENKVNLKPVFA
jgi:hypothetical protein